MKYVSVGKKLYEKVSDGLVFCASFKYEEDCAKVADELNLPNVESSASFEEETPELELISA